MMVRKNGCMNPFIICTIMLGAMVLGSAMLVVANQMPVACADPDHQTVYCGEEAWFSGTNSYDPDGYIVSYYWVFGDGLRYCGENITYTFNAPGNYTVTLTVIDDYGNEDTDSVTVNVLCEWPPSENLTVWIESLATDKQEYDVNESVNTQVTVKRGNDMLTYVWEGTLVLDVFDDAMVLAFTDDRQVYLPSGGTSEIHDFDYTLAEPGDYLVRATLSDFEGSQVDIMEICITISGDPSGGNGTKPPNNDMMVWIESLTTDKDEYDVNEVVNTQVVVKRGDDFLDYVWDGILILEVFDEVMALIYSDEQEVSIPCGGWTQTLNFEYTLSMPGDYLVRATLYDLHDELMDIKEICITVGDDNSGGNGTKPPNDEISMVWIESLTTDKQEYNVDETVKTTVVVQRGDDLLTYVWEGTLVLEVFDEAMVLIFTDDRQVYLPCGGTTETHNFEYTLTEPGDYLVRATLYDFEDNWVDEMEICITVSEEPFGGKGTVPPNLDNTSPPGDNNMGLSNKDKTGALQNSGVLQISLIAIASIAIIALSSVATGRYLNRFSDKEHKK